MLLPHERVGVQLAVNLMRSDSAADLRAQVHWATDEEARTIALVTLAKFTKTLLDQILPPEEVAATLDKFETLILAGESDDPSIE